MTEQLVLTDDVKSYHVNEIKEVLDKCSVDGDTRYLVILKVGGSKNWVSSSKLIGDVTSLTGLGKVGSASTASGHANKDKVKKRKRSSEVNRQKNSSHRESDGDFNASNSDTNKSANSKTISKIPRKPASGRSNSAISTVSTQSSVSIDGTVMLENALEEVGALRIREVFLRRLDAIPGPKVTLVNNIDDTSPRLNFRFIDSCVLREGVTKASEEFMFGCTCKPDNGRHMGCEYTACECLDQMNNRKFPYIATGERAGTLRDGHLSTRDAIFECNRLCNCGDNCKNKLVQWGRKVPLEIFKTSNRGWGLRCPVDLRKGEFIDIYKGEIITNKEANERERAKRKIKAKDTYLYTMEKFAEGNNIPPEMLYIVDGEYLGGPTRFMNHSCDPNCRQFSVSYHHGDMYIYDLAFFAIDFIPAGTELTFNYTDNDHTEQRKKKKSKDSPECLCGSANCRGYIWM